jgi:hypothetical protein
MSDGAEPTDEPEAAEDQEWFTVLRAEIALALSIAAIVVAYLLTESGSSARFAVTFAAGAVSLASLRFLIGHRRDRH